MERIERQDTLIEELNSRLNGVTDNLPKFGQGKPLPLRLKNNFNKI